MSAEETNQITADEIKEILGEEGYEVAPGADDDVFHIKDLESGLTVTCALQENILFNTLPCFALPTSKVTLELARLLLDADNGISTSSFQLYSMSGDQQSVALTNFCKLQNLGHEDRDDILSCVTFLLADVIAARQLLADYA